MTALWSTLPVMAAAAAITASLSWGDAVVSLHHESLVDLFRKNAKLAVALLRSCAKIEVDHARSATESIDLTQVAPIEYRADTVVVLRNRRGRAVAGVVVEVQLAARPEKLLSWPAYVAILRAEYACPAMLLVFAPHENVARWARRSIQLGHPGFQLTPIVIGFDSVPRILDRGAASALPQLAVLSAMAHPELETASVAIEVLSRLPKDKAKLYFDIIFAALSAADRQHLEARMSQYEYQSDFARKYYGEGLEKGLAKGLEKGREEGRKRLRATVVTLARGKINNLPEDILAALHTLSDLDVLNDLVATLGQTRTAAEARAAIDRLCPPHAPQRKSPSPRRRRRKRDVL